MNIEEEGTPLANIMIQIGISEGKAEMLQDIQEAYKKAIKENPAITFPEFMEEFLKNQSDD